MSNENGFDINQIKRCVTTLLPNKVIFALGDSEEVKCASVWIKQLQDRLREAENLINGIKNLEIYDFENFLNYQTTIRNSIAGYIRKYGEKEKV